MFKSKSLLIGMNILLIGIASLMLSTSVVAIEKDSHVSTTFTVENMTCAACPITVKKAMSRVEGVQSVQVDFDAKTATVDYDPELADAKAIEDASSAVGFPAHAMPTTP